MLEAKNMQFEAKLETPADRKPIKSPTKPAESLAQRRMSFNRLQKISSIQIEHSNRSFEPMRDTPDFIPRRSPRPNPGPKTSDIIGLLDNIKHDGSMGSSGFTPKLEFQKSPRKRKLPNLENIMDNLLEGPMTRSAKRKKNKADVFNF